MIEPLDGFKNAFFLTVVQSNFDLFNSVLVLDILFREPHAVAVFVPCHPQVASPDFLQDQLATINLRGYESVLLAPPIEVLLSVLQECASD